MSEVSEVSGNDSATFLDVEEQASDDSSPGCASVDEKSASHGVSGTCKNTSAKAQLDLLLIRGGVKRDALNVLEKLFGKNLLSRVFQQKGSDQLSEYVSQEDILLIIKKIGSVFTFDDLEQIFAELKAGDTTREILQYIQTPLFLTWWARSVIDLPDYWINCLLELFRNPLESMNLTVNENFEQSFSESYSQDPTLFGFESMMRELCKHQDPSSHTFSMSHKEPLARYLAYVDPDTILTGTLVPIFNEETKKLDYYKFGHRISHKGVKCFLLTPIKPSKGRPAQLIFCGTNIRELSSIKRDFDPTGIGNTTFKESVPQIEAMVRAYIQQTPHAEIDILGFSLGGADAQRAMIELFQRAISPIGPICLERIRLFAFCSPKLDKKSLGRWKQSLHSWTSSPQRHPQIELHFAQHENDVITQLGGEGHLSGTPEIYIPVRYLVVRSAHSLFMKKGDHTTAFFDKGNFDHSVDHRTYHIYESVDENLLKQKLHQMVELQKQQDAWYGMIYVAYTTLMSYLFHVTTLPNLQREIEELKSKREKFQEWSSRRTWLTGIISYILCYAIWSAASLFWGSEESEATIA